jgi:hypothetical protein
MKKYFVPFLLFLCFQSYSQKSSQKAVTETCDCLKKGEQAKTEFPAAACLGNALKKNFTALKAEYAIKSTNDEQAMKEVAEKLKPMLSQCPEFVKASMEYMSKQQANTKKDINVDTLKLDKTVCKAYQSGKVKVVKMYMNYVLIDIPAGAYSEYKDGFLYDYEENGKFVTKWSLKWPNDCEYEQTLVESNSPNTTAMFKKGDKISSRAIGSTKDKKIYWFCQMMGMDFIALTEKMK